MSRKLKGKALEKFEAERDVWREVLEGVREINSGTGKRNKVGSNVECGPHTHQERLGLSLSSPQSQPDKDPVRIQPRKNS